MSVVLCSLVSELADKVSWLYHEGEWTRQALLLIVLGLSVLLLLILRRRRKRNIRTIYPEHFASCSSVIGAKLADRRHPRNFAEARRVLAARMVAYQEELGKANKVVKHQQKSDEQAGRRPWDTVKPRQPKENSTAKVAELSTANEPLFREAGEGESGVHILKNKIAELTAANEQLRSEVAKLRKASPKQRADASEGEHRIVAHVGQKLSRRFGESKTKPNRRVEAIVQGKRLKRYKRTSSLLVAVMQCNLQAEIKPPLQLLEELVEDIRDLNLQKGIAGCPEAKLDAALKALGGLHANDDGAAVRALGEFITVVESERHDDHRILRDDAQDLIDATREIVNLLAVEQSAP